MKSAIYTITNTVNRKSYVGSAVNFDNRWHIHRSQLQHKTHHSLKLQRAWDKYGADAFEFGVVEYVADVTQLIAREQVWIDLLDVCAAGYNIAPKAGSTLGVKHSDEAKAKMSASRIGITHSDEAKAKISASHIGMTHSEESKAKISAARIGKTNTEETKAKRRATLKTLDTWTGRTHSEDSKAKMSANSTGKIHSEETKAKMTAAQKARWAIKKSTATI